MNRLVTVAVLLAVLTAHTSPIYATTTTAVFTNTSLPASSAAARVSTTTAVPVTTTATTAVPSTTVTTVSPSTAKYVCKDLNTDACRQLNASKQGYCNDVPLSKPICPRFCGHCPSVCYHCDNVVANISDCTTTKVCGQDQMCMIKRLSSTLDGHHEYQLSCEDKQVCDGQGLTFPFVGRRAIESRDVSVHCCKDDYCNYPKELRTTTTTTQVPVTIATGCSRDIMFMIDTSHRININGHQHHLTHNLQSSLQLVHDIVSQLTIGPYDNLVSLATFGRSVHSQWDLDDHYSKADLLKAIANVHQRVQFTSHGDLEDALNYLIKHVMESNHGDRKGYPDDVIIITDSSSSFHNSLLTSQLQRKSRDVILISVGSQPGSVSQIATDSTHKIHVNSYTDLPSIGRRLFRLLFTVAVLLAVLNAHTSPIYATTTTAVFTNTSLPASSAAARVSTTTAVPVTTTATTAVPSTTVTTVSPSTAKYVCKDLNTDACRQLNASKQGYCNDVPLSKPICPRFCGHCPSVCYHCDNVIANINDCTTTKVCGQDQIENDCSAFTNEKDQLCSFHCFAVVHNI